MCLYMFILSQAHLSNGEGLLLHDLVQHGSSAVAHFVELVNTTDAVVTQNQGSGLQDQLPGLWILHDVGSETHGAGALSGRVLAAWHQVVDVLQQLGLAGARVSAEQDVHIGAEVTTAGLTEILTSAAEQLQQNTLKHKERGSKYKLLNY